MWLVARDGRMPARTQAAFMILGAVGWRPRTTPGAAQRGLAAQRSFWNELSGAADQPRRQRQEDGVGEDEHEER